jgi:hypothetical protein
MTLWDIVVWDVIVPIIVYYLGILVRHRLFRKEGDPTLSDQLLLGIVGIMLVLPALSFGVNNALKGIVSEGGSDASLLFNSVAAYLIALGIVFEHGLIVQESLRQKIAERLTANLRRKEAAKRKLADKSR